MITLCAVHVYAQQLWRQKLWRCRSTNLEVCRAVCEQFINISHKHFKTLTDNIHVSTRSRRFVTFYISALEILLFTYLLTLCPV